MQKLSSYRCLVSRRSLILRRHRKRLFAFRQSCFTQASQMLPSAEPSAVSSCSQWQAREWKNNPLLRSLNFVRATSKTSNGFCLSLEASYLGAVKKKSMIQEEGEEELTTSCLLLSWPWRICHKTFEKCFFLNCLWLILESWPNLTLYPKITWLTENLHRLILCGIQERCAFWA